MVHYKNYKDISDEELVLEIKKEKNEYAYNELISRYEHGIRAMSKNYFSIGAEDADFLQEGLIGLYLAVKNFDKEKDVYFKTFANICIKRRLNTFIKTLNRKKNWTIAQSISLDDKIGCDSDENNKIIDMIEDKTAKDPCNMIIENEYNEQIQSAIYSKLSFREKNVLNEYIKGKSYVDIAECLNLNVKSVDTALTRVRRKANEVRKEF